ncbi:ATP-binding cassette domain-containing protein [Clostridium perfringens]|uniref:ATP-binding cassette domain-containing protein n=1 Tax=Clostridium perfringens TaxID=1502 RepID=A0AAW9IEQ5_CLOPF|nr:ATP-binding cassette domain-containing protein [Clostridium perfringens]
MILDNINLDIEKGKITALIGSNGCGKSTLIKAIARILAPKSGTISMEDRDILKMPSKEVAKLLAMLPQSSNALEDITIYDLVKQGRYPYHTLLSFWSKRDEDIVLESIKKVGLIDEKDRTLNNLSGGQRQRAWIAMTLAQETDIIMLDEPTTYLDMSYQLEVLEVLQKLNKEKQITVVIVLHELNNACRFADNIIGLKKGKIICEGRPIDVITKESLKEIYGVGANLQTSENGEYPICMEYELLRVELE